MKKITTLIILLSCFSVLVTGLNAQIVEAKHLAPQISNRIGSSNLQIDVPQAGEYYLCFWMLPARLSNGKLAIYEVIVNEQVVGHITPSKPNWQSLSLDGNKKVFLSKGSSVITVTGSAGEIPLVEDVHYGHDLNKCHFSSEAYESYLSQVSHLNEKELFGSTYDTNVVNENDKLMLMQQYRTGGDGLFPRVPVYYSFYMTKFIEQGETLEVMTTADQAHYVDLFYCASSTYWTGPLRPDEDPYLTIIHGIDPCDSLTQQLGWLAISEPFANTPNRHRSFKRITIPKSGLYCIKLRTKENGIKGKANVIIDNSLFYEDQPIASTHYSTTIPANQQRASFTLSLKEDTDDNSNLDPRLFIEGAGGNRVVSYGTNIPDSLRNLYGCKNGDDLILMKYSMPATGVHVAGRRSNAPVFYCHIIANSDPIVVDNLRKEPTLYNQTLASPSQQHNIDVSIEENNQINIKSVNSGNIKAIQVVNQMGISVYTKTFNSEVAIIDLNDIRSKSSTFYSVVVYTDYGVYSRNILL